MIRRSYLLRRRAAERERAYAVRPSATPTPFVRYSAWFSPAGGSCTGSSSAASSGAGSSAFGSLTGASSTGISSVGVSSISGSSVLGYSAALSLFSFMASAAILAYAASVEARLCWAHAAFICCMFMSRSFPFFTAQSAGLTLSVRPIVFTSPAARYCFPGILGTRKRNARQAVSAERPYGYAAGRRRLYRLFIDYMGYISTKQ